MIDDPRLKGLKAGVYIVEASDYPIRVTGVCYPDGKLFGHVSVQLNCDCCTEDEPLEDYYNFGELEDEIKEEIILQLLKQEE